MRKITLIVTLTLALGLLAAPLPVEAQKGKIYRIGYVAGGGRSAGVYLLKAFQQGMREFGYAQGQNIRIESRYAEGKFERLPALIAELVRLNVDVIVTLSTPASLAARKATRTIPIVLAVVGDPVGSGLIASLARPGGNVTGLSFVGPETVGKQLELLKKTVPSASRVAVLWNPADPYAPRLFRQAEIAARVLGVQLQMVEGPSPDEFDSAFEAMARERADALLVIASSFFFTYRKQLADLAAKHHLPAMYGLTVRAKTGGLMAYSPNLPDAVRYSATFVHKILRGAKPADLPVEQPTKFDFVINLKTANALGLTIPPSVLVRADRVIE